MNIGVHQFTDTEGMSSYFVQRSYGNYLLFSENCSDYDYEFLKSRGGIFKQFIESLDNIRKTQASIFSKYGASAVGHFGEKAYHPDLPVESFNVDFYDKEIRFPNFSGRQHILLKQAHAKIVVFGSAYQLKNDENIYVNSMDETKKLHRYFSDEGISYAFFTRHEKHHMLTIKREKSS